VPPHRPRPVEAADHAWVLALNGTLEIELSPLTLDSLNALLAGAFMTRAVDAEGGFLIAFDEGAAYESANYQWFKQRYERFVYVDRIAVAKHARGQGVAKSFYHALFETARAADHVRIVCEVNIDPPNPGSDAFHASLGFHEIGQATLDGGKTVRYLEIAL